MPQLDVATYSSQIFWLAICILTLYTSLKYIFIPRLESSIDARKKKIEKLILDASKLQLEADKLNEKYAEEIKKVHIEAHQFHKKALKEFDESCKIELAKLSSEQEEKLNKFRVELEVAKKDFAEKIEAQSDILLESLINKISSIEKTSLKKGKL